MKALYLEDIVAGQIFGSSRTTISDEEIIRFAREFDPQPFHLDPEAVRSAIQRS